MDSFEVTVDGELFRISESHEPNAATGYDFSWLNGPADGTYGFSVGGPKMSREQLIAAVRDFVDSFYEDGGIGQEDFPDHVPARSR